MKALIKEIIGALAVVDHGQCLLFELFIILAAATSCLFRTGPSHKGLWYNWVYSADGWPGLEIVAPLYRSHLEHGTIAVPDLYVVLTATEAQLRQRKANDSGRRRRRFEKHLRLIEAQRRYFSALQEVAPGRVLIVDTTIQCLFEHMVQLITNATFVNKPRIMSFQS